MDIQHSWVDFAHAVVIPSRKIRNGFNPRFDLLKFFHYQNFTVGLFSGSTGIMPGQTFTKILEYACRNSSKVDVRGKKASIFTARKALTDTEMMEEIRYPILDLSLEHDCEEFKKLLGIVAFLITQQWRGPIKVPGVLNYNFLGIRVCFVRFEEQVFGVTIDFDDDRGNKEWDCNARPFGHRKMFVGPDAQFLSRTQVIPVRECHKALTS